MTREEALNILERINADVDEGLGYDHEKWVAEVEEAYKTYAKGMTAACKAFTPKEEQKREETPMYEIDEATQKIVKRLDRASMHFRALGEVEMSYDIDMGALKIKELYAKCASMEALIREKFSTNEEAADIPFYIHIDSKGI